MFGVTLVVCHRLSGLSTYMLMAAVWEMIILPMLLWTKASLTFTTAQ